MKNKCILNLTKNYRYMFLCANKDTHNLGYYISNWHFLSFHLCCCRYWTHVFSQERIMLIWQFLTRGTVLLGAIFVVTVNFFTKALLSWCLTPVNFTNIKFFGCFMKSSASIYSLTTKFDEISCNNIWNILCCIRQNAFVDVRMKNTISISQYSFKQKKSYKGMEK